MEKNDMKIVFNKFSNSLFIHKDSIFIDNSLYIKYNSEYQYCNKINKENIKLWLSFHKTKRGKIFLRKNLSVNSGYILYGVG
jgi:hypothetical protein